MSLYRYFLKLKQIVLTRFFRKLRGTTGLCVCLLTVFWLLCFLYVCFIRYVEKNNEPLAVHNPFIYIEPLNGFFRRTRNRNGEKVDWHDYKMIAEEEQREGPGEHGEAVTLLTNETEINKKIFDENGYNAYISDKISVNRSVTKCRHPDCLTKHYLKELPSVSIIIPVFDEHLSTLLRTVHSYINRSPPEILKEIIMVNDNSTKENLKIPLQDYIDKNWPSGKVKLIILPSRHGLMRTRLIGARAATGDVLLFSDSHMEANTNWLPPLIEPIAEDYRTATCPMIDVINYDTYAYEPAVPYIRGIFDWYMNFQRLPLRPQDQVNPTDPYPDPVMLGCIFAISAKFFWEIGGYDIGLNIWGGEQYETSFKVWLCGGKMLDTPCSRVAHTYRHFFPKQYYAPVEGQDVVAENFKRVAEIWMDEYKEYFYMRQRERYAKLNAGDISYPVYLRNKMKCKPFKFFIEEVAPDMVKRYPLVDPEPFAGGIIRSLAFPDLCIGKSNTNNVALFPCSANVTHPDDYQNFVLRHYRDIQMTKWFSCLDTHELNVFCASCHNNQENQYFRYDLDTKMIAHGPVSLGDCIDCELDSRRVTVVKCNYTSPTQQWEWGWINEEKVRHWTKNGAPISNLQEIKDLEALAAKEVL